ncbi:MAG: alpha/beta hydrolase fold family protein [Pseudoduganella sp.]|nr:alpha/beta hydrolase fold family protein [Pseudoduganella sp.]
MTVSELPTHMENKMRNLLAIGAQMGALLTPLANAQAAAQQPPKIEHPPGRMVEVNGTSLWVETEGKGEPLVVLVGGPSNSHVSMHPAFSALSDRFQVIYYDYRGRGRSTPAAPREVTFNGDVADLEGLRVALGLPRMHIYGFSYGGLVAQAYALTHPDRVGRLILANTLYSAEMWKLNHDNINAEIQRQYPEVWERIATLHAKGVRSSAPEMQELFAIHGPLIRWYNPDKAHLLWKEEGSVNKALYWEFVGDNIDFEVGGEVAKLPDFRHRLHELRMPTLIMAGRFDRALYPQLQMDFKRYCPQAKFVMLERSGSFGHVEEPETVIPLVRAFLDAQN